MNWADELKDLGWERMLVSRLEFHGRLTEAMVIHNTGRSRSTVHKHFQRLVEAGKARSDIFRGEPAIIPPLSS